MDAKTLEALKLSIAHWEDNVRAKVFSEVNIGAQYCALCALFNPPGVCPSKACNGCPVFENTKQKYCIGTPYITAHQTNIGWLPPEMNISVAFTAAAQDELDFLKSLLPEGETT